MGRGVARLIGCALEEPPRDGWSWWRTLDRVDTPRDGWVVVSLVWSQQTSRWVVVVALTRYWKKFLEMGGVTRLIGRTLEEPRREGWSCVTRLIRCTLEEAPRDGWVTVSLA